MGEALPSELGGLQLTPLQGYQGLDPRPVTGAWMKARELWEWCTDIWQPGWGGGPSVHTLVRSCPHLPHPKSCPSPGLGYWAGCAPDPAVAPFSWGVLDIRKKVVLMAWWQLSMSVGTSATVRPLVGMASSTSTLMVAEVKSFVLGL